MANKLGVHTQPDEPEPTTERLEKSSVFWRTGLCRCGHCGGIIQPTGLTHNRAEYGYWVDCVLTADGEPVCAVHEQCMLPVICYGPRHEGHAQEFQQLYRDYHQKRG